MSEHAQFLDRAAAKLQDLEAAVRDLESRGGSEGAGQRRVADLAASVAAARERLTSLRMQGADLTAETTQSFGASLERLSAEIGRARAEQR